MQGSWEIYLRKYVFMYCHDLRMFKKSVDYYSIPCEDGVDGYMAITPYDLKLDEVTLTQIVAVLSAWARAEKLRCRIYTAFDRYETFEPPESPSREERA